MTEDTEPIVTAGDAGTDLRLLEQEGEYAADYLETLLDIVDLDGDIDMDVENGRASVSIVGGSDLRKLVGRQGETLEALQELTRLAVVQQTNVRSRLMLDIGGYRAGRRRELAELGARTARQVKATRQPQTLAAMTPFERKVIHDAVAEIPGVRSESEGEEPSRCVVVRPDDESP
jgi:spoIIIJ-associated protein